MAEIPPQVPASLPSRRSFLHDLAAVGGIGLVMAGLDAFGMSMASAQTAPPALTGSGAGKRVVILGAGVAGMTAAYELSKLGYRCQVIEARSFAGGRCQSKIGLQMRRRFWEEDHFIYGGHVHTDNEEIGSTSLPSSGWQGAGVPCSATISSTPPPSGSAP